MLKGSVCAFQLFLKAIKRKVDFNIFSNHDRKKKNSAMVLFYLVEGSNIKCTFSGLLCVKIYVCVCWKEDRIYKKSSAENLQYLEGKKHQRKCRKSSGKLEFEIIESSRRTTIPRALKSTTTGLQKSWRISSHSL